MKYRVLDLFSGIGGFSLGLERTGGFETVAFCEIDPFCRKVLAKHWPNVRQYDDVRELTAARLHSDGISVDVICGGFPCQDITSNGTKAGVTSGARSGLWREFFRIIGELRPCYVLVENVADLLHRGVDRVLGDLAEIGFDAEWHCIPASAVGRPIGREGRDRIWIVAEPERGGFQGEGLSRQIAGQLVACSAGGYRDQPRLSGSTSDYRKDQSGVDRVADGISNRAHRIAALGNAVVPQIPEIIGRAILQAHEAREAA